MEITLRIDDFEGPMDLLLHLIKEKKMDLLNLKIEVIIDEYLKFIDEMERLNLDIASSYLVMASELIEMKSRLLLPRQAEVEEEEEDPKQDLVNRLIEYQRYKDLTEDFKELENERKQIYTRLPENLKEYSDSNKVINNSDVSLNDLLEAFQKFLERKKLEQPLHTKVTKKEYSVDDSIKSIKTKLKKGVKVDFFSLFETKTKSYIVVTFLAILELAKLGELLISQDKKTKNITCEAI